MVSKYNYKLSCGHYLLYRNIEDKPRKLQDTKKKKLKTHLPLTLAYKIHYFFFFHNIHNKYSKRTRIRSQKVKHLGKTTDLEEYQILMKLQHFVQKSISADQVIHHLLPVMQHLQLPSPFQFVRMTVQDKEKL